MNCYFRNVRHSNLHTPFTHSLKTPFTVNREIKGLTSNTNMTVLYYIYIYNLYILYIYSTYLYVCVCVYLCELDWIVSHFDGSNY